MQEVEGVGYLVTVAPGAPARPTFRYQISDGKSDPVSAVVVVAVTDAVTVDQPPVARADVVEVRAGGKVHVPVLKNDYDPEGGVLEVVSVTPFDGADVAPGLNGQTVDVRVGAGVISSFTLSYTVADEAGNQSSAFLEVRIVPADEVNRPPIARTDTARTRSGVPVLIEVVANDSDPDGDIIAAENIRTQPTGGTARVEDGAVVYTPSDTFAGTDRFSYALVDAGGEIAIGEVLVGVMPLRRREPGPGGVRRRRPSRRRQRAARVRRARQRLRPRRRPRARDDRRHAVERRGRGRRGRRRGAVHAAGRHRRRGTPTEIAFPYSIDDGRGGTASAIVTVEVIAASEPIAPIAVDDQVGPVTPGQTIERRPARQRPRPRRQPRRARRSTPSDPALADRDGGVVTITAGTTSSRHVYTITDADGLTDQAEVAVLVVPNRAPVVEAVHGADTGQRGDRRSTSAAPAVDPDGDTLYFACCDHPHGGAATTVSSGPGELTRVLRPRRRLRRAGDVLLHRRRPGRPRRRRRRRRSRCSPPTNRPPAATDGTFTVEAGITTNIDLGSLVTDPDPADTLRYTVDGPAAGRRGARPRRRHRAGIGVDRSRRADRLVHLHRHRRRRRVGVGDGQRSPSPAVGTAAPRPRGDAATTNQDQAVTVGVLGNDIDPLGQGLTRRLRRRRRRPARRRPTAPR